MRKELEEASQRISALSYPSFDEMLTTLVMEQVGYLLRVYEKDVDAGDTTIKNVLKGVLLTAQEVRSLHRHLRQGSNAQDAERVHQKVIDVLKKNGFMAELTTLGLEVQLQTGQSENSPSIVIR